jgi:hypothetical protein
MEAATAFVSNHWTPETRNEFIAEAINSDKSKGNRGGYFFNVLPKLENVVEVEDVKRIKVTEILAEIVNKREYKPIIMGFYHMLFQKLACHPYIGCHFMRDVILLIKGSNAHRYLVKDKSAFPFSDTDIVVCINPNLCKPLFENIKNQVEITVKQTLSQYKRILDHFLFLHKHYDNDFINMEMTDAFKEAFTKHLYESNDEIPEGILMSPFATDDVRNSCSKNSFLLTNSRVQDNSVVRIELPHFDRCERIPLRKTPLICSFNETIDFKRDGDCGDKAGKFNLYRLKMNVLCVHSDEEGKIVKEERVPADFIDVSVPYQEDAELAHFWQHGRFVNVFDVEVGMWIAIPDLATSIAELERILRNYTSVDYKKEKREKKLAVMKAALGAF